MATEKRLIDANELKKRMLALATAWRTNILLVDAIIDRIDTESTVDAVEVVRCKDCKHYDKDALWCNINSHAFGEPSYNWYEEDYCSYGERKDND